MSKRVVPSVVVGKKENGAVRATNNECMHVGEFGSVRNLNGFETNVWRERMEAPCRRRNSREHTLFDHQ